MKKRWAALACCLVLLVQLAMPAGAAETVFFTAVNETVLELDDSTMPFWSGGYLYAPSTVFRDLGVGHSKNLMQGMVIMYGQNRHLEFDLNAGTVEDSDGAVRKPAAIRRGSVVFLPVALMADTFGLTYGSTQRVNHGYLLRLTNSSAVLNDANFFDAVPSVLEERYSNYMKNKAPAEDTTQTQEQVTVTGKRIFLCASVPVGADLTPLLDALQAYNSQAAFYFAPEAMEEQGDALRRMAAEGHGVGILADAGREDLTVEEQTALANAALERATCGKTRLVRLENATDQAAEMLAAAGFSLLDPTLDRSAYGLGSSSAATALLKRVNDRRGAVSVWLGERVYPLPLRTFLKAARDGREYCLAMTETGM